MFVVSRKADWCEYDVMAVLAIDKLHAERCARCNSSYFAKGEVIVTEIKAGKQKESYFDFKCGSVIMRNILGSIGTIKNFMGNAGRNTCNEYLYNALLDAVESMKMNVAMKPTWK